MSVFSTYKLDVALLIMAHAHLLYAICARQLLNQYINWLVKKFVSLLAISPTFGKVRSDEQSLLRAQR